MASYHVDRWAKEATAKIRFAPDKAWVAEELRAHLEDRKEALMERGLEEREAERRAIESMGEAQAIADELAALHSPWPGWFWRASKIALWVAVIAAVVIMLDAGFNFGKMITPIARHIQLNLYMDPDWRDLNASPEAAEHTREMVAQVERGDTAAAFGRLWTVRSGRVLREHYYDTEGSEEAHTLYLNLWSLTPRLGDLLSDQVGRNLWVRDSLGNTYPAQNTVDIKTAERYTAGDNDADGLFHTRLLVMVLHFDPAAEWVELVCDRSDEPFTLRVELQEVAG